MECEFCEIAMGRASAQIAWQTRNVTVFADHNPIRTGHVQIIPRAHYTCFDDLPSSLASEIMLLGQHIARSQKRLYGVNRIAFAFSGSDVAHCHAHVFPIHEKTDLTSMRYFQGPVPDRHIIEQANTVALAQTATSLARALCEEI